MLPAMVQTTMMDQLRIDNDGDRLNSGFRINQAADDIDSEDLNNGNRDSQSETEFGLEQGNYDATIQNDLNQNEVVDQSSVVATVETKNFAAGQDANDDNKNSANAGVDMKETGIPIVAILLVLLSCIGVGVFKRQK